MMKKKKHSCTPKRKRLNKDQRISMANNWLQSYKGRNIVQGYSKWFGVDLLSAITELRLAGASVSVDYEREIIKAKEAKINQRKLKNENSEFQQDQINEWDKEFDFIAGYTSNGVPYGI